jgi:hypothetical protein
MVFGSALHCHRVSHGLLHVVNVLYCLLLLMLPTRICNFAPPPIQHPIQRARAQSSSSKAAPQHLHRLQDVRGPS